MPLHPLERNYLDTLREDREAILLADELGFEEAFVGEHVTDHAETITSCLSFIASLAYQTKSIKLGSGTLNLPNSHPASIAAHVAMVDHMCEGRFIMGISPGGLRSDAEVFGNLDKDRNAMFDECIAQVLQIWSSDAPYNIEGEFWRITTERTLDADIGQGKILGPLQKPHPPIVVTCMSPFSSSAAKAALQNWSLISANFLLPCWVNSHWQKMLEGWQESGLSPNANQWRVAKSIFVADDDGSAKSYAKDPNGPYGHYYKSLMHKLIGNGRADLFKTDPDMDDSAVTLEYVLDNLVIAGSVDRVVDELQQFQEEVGEFGTLVYAGHDWADAKLAKRSMVLMAEQVLPKLDA